MITPFFLPWRARLSALRWSLPALETSQLVVHQLSSLFASLLPAHWLSPREEGPCSRQRDWPLRLTFWTFLAQVLSPGSSCRSAIRQAQAQARLEQRPGPSSKTSPYCQARARLPLDLLQEMLHKVGQSLQQRVPRLSLWCGRTVKVLDGSTYNLPDTPENQAAFPQSTDQEPGCGFPLVRLVVVFCLASGAVVSWAFGPYLQSELALLASLWESLQAGEVLLADRHFGCYRVLAQVLDRQADAVCRLHASRKSGVPKKRGAFDVQTLWTRPKEVGAGFTLEQWLQLPASLTVRLVRFHVVEKGFRAQWITVVTTLLDAQQYPPAELARLYRRRWQVELSLRQIKTALQMESLSTRSPEMAERELLMHLFAYQLIRGLMQEAALAAGMPLERISFVGAVDAARHFGEVILRAKSQRQRRRLYAELLEILAADAVPDRPGRREPRALKRRPKRFPRLNCPRALFRDPPRRSSHTKKTLSLI